MPCPPCQQLTYSGSANNRTDFAASPVATSCVPRALPPLFPDTFTHNGGYSAPFPPLIFGGGCFAHPPYFPFSRFTLSSFLILLKGGCPASNEGGAPPLFPTDLLIYKGGAFFSCS